MEIPDPVCNRAKSFGAALGCDDPGSRRRFGKCNFHRYRSSHQPVTSFRQIEANRRNALRSTGPTTEDGKRRSRQNAVRHGLSAETVVEIVEDIDDYRGFEAAIIADYDARTAVERELVLRLASLLWRLRRATMIETELLRIQAEVLRDRRSSHLAVRSRNTPSPILGDAIPAVQDVQEDQTDSEPVAGRPLHFAFGAAISQLCARPRALLPTACQSRQWGIRTARTV